MMVYFRKRLGKDIINEINELIAKDAAKSKDDDSNRRGGKKSGTKKDSATQEDLLENQGTLLLDATCAPADIHYPTDLWLLNETREDWKKSLTFCINPTLVKAGSPVHTAKAHGKAI